MSQSFIRAFESWVHVVVNRYKYPVISLTVQSSVYEQLEQYYRDLGYAKQGMRTYQFYGPWEQPIKILKGKE